MNKNLQPVTILLFSICIIPMETHAQTTLTDYFNGPKESLGWKPFDGACLTAGDNTGQIKACNGLPYYNGKVQVGGANGTLPDLPGRGALRLTNGGNDGTDQKGAILTTTPIKATTGIKVKFTAVTYGGNGFSNPGYPQSGADGIGFFLLDAGNGSEPPPSNIGAAGGAFGYTCRNKPWEPDVDGVTNGYIGLGIDEYGNFTNPVDVTSTGPGYLPGSISIRGSGSVNWNSLNQSYPTLYPSSVPQKKEAVSQVCSTGKLYNLSGSTQVVNGKTIPPGAEFATVKNYNLLFANTLPSTVKLQNQQAIPNPSRANATPIAFDISITSNGLLTLAYSINNGGYTTAVSQQSITASNGIRPEYYWAGFSSSTGWGSNVHEIMCFQAEPNNSAADSAAVNSQQSSKLEAGTQVYLAVYNKSNWWGRLTANPLVYTPATNSVSIGQSANWDANCGLTGGACATTGVSNTAQGNRKILTWNGAAGIPFQWGDLTQTQRDALGGNQNVLNYLRGDRSNEIGNGPGSYRTRTGLLGDSINSSPIWVGPPSLPYNGPWVDKLTKVKGSEQESYKDFSTQRANRANMVYVGANDGFLHGFRSGGYDAAGSFSTLQTPNDGKELIAYAPSKAVETLHNSSNATISFLSPQYSHTSYVDATPGSGDLFYKGAWHTWLVGGLGAGGNATGVIGDTTSTGVGNIFVLDITDPANFSEANASSLVIGDWSSATISCVSVANCGSNLGNTYGTPIIRRLHDGNWAVIFGNGLNSSTGTAGIFVMTVNKSTGQPTFRFLDTGYTPVKDPLGGGAKNGIAYVSSADLDNDHITDYVYAGDVFGNLWRFDLTSSNPGQWAAPRQPIFSTSAGQPITTRVTVSSVPQSTGHPKVIINFGTGRELPQTPTRGAIYQTQGQSLYGIWDSNLGRWNSESAVQYSSLAASQPVRMASLQIQTLSSLNANIGGISEYRKVNANRVAWADGSGVYPNTQYGWKIDLPKNSEQVIYNPTNNFGLFIVNTTIPAVNDIFSCSSVPESGFTMALTPDGGAAPTKSFFGSALPNIGTDGVVGIRLDATGTPWFVTAMKKNYMVSQTVSGTGNVTQVDPPVGNTGARINWIKLR